MCRGLVEDFLLEAMEASWMVLSSILESGKKVDKFGGRKVENDKRNKSERSKNGCC